MESTVLSKDVQPVVQHMDSAVLAVKDYGNVDAMMAGMVPTAPFNWNKIVPIIKTMTKVNKYTSYTHTHTHIVVIVHRLNVCA